MITNEHLGDIEHAFDENVLEEIFAQYRRCGTKPSEKVREALGRVYGRTIEELESQFEAFATAA